MNTNRFVYRQNYVWQKIYRFDDEYRAECKMACAILLTFFFFSFAHCFSHVSFYSPLPFYLFLPPPNDSTSSYTPSTLGRVQFDLFRTRNVQGRCRDHSSIV